MSRIDLIVWVFWGLFKESPPLVESINMKEGFYAIIWSSSRVWLRIILLIIFGGLTSTFMKLVEDWLLDDLLLFSLIVGAVLMSRKWEIKWWLSLQISPLLFSSGYMLVPLSIFLARVTIFICPSHVWTVVRLGWGFKAFKGICEGCFSKWHPFRGQSSDLNPVRVIPIKIEVFQGIVQPCLVHSQVAEILHHVTSVI